MEDINKMSAGELLTYIDSLDYKGWLATQAGKHTPAQLKEEFFEPVEEALKLYKQKYAGKTWR